MKKRDLQTRQSERQLTIVSLLSERVDPRITRRVLEIHHPIPLYVLVEKQNRYRLIGQPGLPGHFQIGALHAQRKEWTPAPDQEDLIWESLRERDSTLHRLHCRPDVGAEVALVQHFPTYTHLQGKRVLEDINQVEVTPLWDAEPSTLPCALTHECGCQVYQTLLETLRYQWRGQQA